MDSQHNEHGGHGEGAGVHLPDPSVWPLIVGLAALVVGIALIWWSRDRSNDFSGPILGAAVVCALVAVGGWAYDDSRMRKKAEAGHGGHGEGPVRFTQVLTFAIAEGELAAARSAGGVIDALENTDLRDVDGFQDLRVIVTPAGSGPAQALAETTWSAREGLAGYDATRQTLLDVITAHTAQVVPGSVQVFDMEVVRDTKDVTFKFGLGAAGALFGALIAGGFMIGAGLTLFQEDATVVADGGGGGETPVANPFAVTATDNKFDKATLSAPPNTDVTFDFTNKGKAKHNLSFYQSAGGAVIKEGEIIDGGATTKVSFKTPAAGNYYFQCDLHPTEMKGTFEVKEGAAAPGAAAGGGAAAPAGAVTVTGTDNKFDKTTLTGSAGKEFSVTLTNKGKAKHNISFYDKQNGAVLVPGKSEGEIIDGGKSSTLTFTPPAAGKFFYQCDLHPTEMKGEFTVS